MVDRFRQARQSQNRTSFGLRFFLEILPVDCVQIVRALLGDDLNGLEAFIDVWLFFCEIVGICGIWIELVPLGEADLTRQ
jgi:hypothetical protein